MSRAPRRPSRPWRGLARGAGLAGALLAGEASACKQSPIMDAVRGSVVELPSADPGAPTVAWFEDLTDAYAHGVLGDALEPTTLRALTSDSAVACGLSVTAGPGHVFEDVAPRLADVDGDGRAEVIAVRSAFDKGAQLVVYTVRADGLIPLAETPFIGTPNRWLAPTAIADLDGDGAVEIAYVDRPHLARVLRIWRYADGALREAAAASGVTNHRIGEPFISGGLRDCGAGPRIVLASADWSRLLELRFDGRAISARDLGPWSAHSAERALACAR